MISLARLAYAALGAGGGVRPSLARPADPGRSGERVLPDLVGVGILGDNDITPSL